MCLMVLFGTQLRPADGFHSAKLVYDVQFQGVVPSHNIPLFLNHLSWDLDVTMSDS